MAKEIKGQFEVKANYRNDGMQLIYSFANGYGASVINSDTSYGTANQWEIAVLDNQGDLCYDTPITEDVLGHLSFGDVEKTLVRISRL